VMYFCILAVVAVQLVLAKQDMPKNAKLPNSPKIEYQTELMSRNIIHNSTSTKEKATTTSVLLSPEKLAIIKEALKDCQTANYCPLKNK